MRHFSPAVHVALSPHDAYSTLVLQASAVRYELWIRLACLTILTGTAIAICATGRVTLGLALSVSVYWAFVPLMQMTAALAIILPARRRAVPVSRALELFFLGHLPWSLWLLALAGVVSLTSAPFPDTLLVVFSTIGPGAWTLVIIVAFCKTVLQMPARRAQMAALVHQSLLWTLTVTALLWVSGGWARFLGSSAP